MERRETRLRVVENEGVRLEVYQLGTGNYKSELLSERCNPWRVRRLPASLCAEVEGMVMDRSLVPAGAARKKMEWAENLEPNLEKVGTSLTPTSALCHPHAWPGTAYY